MDRRRLLVAGLASLVLPDVARAQTTTGGCTVGFLHGLLQFDPNCATLTIPGLPMSVSPPSHLVAAIDDGAVSTENPLHIERVTQLQKHRQKKRRKQNRHAGKHDNRHTQRSRKRSRRHADQAQAASTSNTS